MHHRWRFRLRSLLLLVALVSVLCSGGVMLLLRRHYLTEAATHDALAAQHKSAAQGRFWFEKSGRVRELNAPNHSALSEYHESLAREYQRAAHRPWLRGPTDPPLPE